MESTIDLVLATAEVANAMATCSIHPIEHGSDHRAIQTTFDVATPERIADYHEKTVVQERIENNQNQGGEQSSRASLNCRRAGDRPANEGRPRGDPQADTPNTTSTVREALVDEGLDKTPAGVHVLAKSGQGTAASRPGEARPGKMGQGSKA